MNDFLDVLGNYDFFARSSIIMLLLALSIYVLMHAGMFAVPQVGFMAIGAYTAAVLSVHLKLPFFVSLVGGVVVTALAGFLLSLLLSRLNGIYLAISTIAFGEMVRVIARNLEFTGGAAGLIGIPRAAGDLYIVGSIVLVVYILVRLSRSRFGLAITLIREDPLTAAHQGVNLRRYRIGLFALSGAVAGLAGGLYVHLTGFVEPGMFSFDLLIDALAAVVVGGMFTFIGPLIGGIIIFGLPEVLSGFEDYRTVANGAIIVLVIAFAPSGLVSLFEGLWRRVRHSSPKTDAQSGPDAIHVDDWEGIGPGAALEFSEKALQVSVIRKAFGGIRALDGVSLDVHRGEILGLIGPNGSGKTTLLNVISGVYHPDEGTMRVGDEDVSAKLGRPDRVAPYGISRTFQAIRLIPDLSVEKNISAGAYLWQEDTLLDTMLMLPRNRESKRRVDRMVKGLLNELEMTRLADLPAGSLPYGTQRKVEIARALASRPQILLLDEPTAGMTPEEREEVFQLVRQIRASGITVVVVEHDVSTMTEHCDRLAALNQGTMLALGDPHEVIQERTVVDAYIGRSA